MIKTKSQKRIFMLLAALLLLSNTSFAAKAVKYDWIGAVDLNWDTPGNWDVSGSSWTWPNEEYGGSWINQDCDEINIATGGIVDRSGSLNINGPTDGSNEVVLTIDNSSELNVHGDIWIANGGDSKGRVEVRDGSHLELGAIRIGNGNTSVGTLSIIDGTVDIAQWLIVGRTTTGIVEIKNSTLNIAGSGGWSSLYIAYISYSSGTLNVNTGNINIEDSLLVGCADYSTGTVEIKNGNLNISKHLSLGHSGQGTSCYMSIKNNSIIDIGANLNVGNSGSSTGTLEIKDSTLDIGSNIQVGNSDNSTGTLEIKDSTLDIGSNIQVGNSGNSTGTLEIKSSTVGINNDLLVGGTDFSTGEVEIKDSIINIGSRIVLADIGTSGTMHVKNSVIDVGNRFIMNNNLGSGATSEFVMDDGSVSVGGHSHLGYKAGTGSMAKFTINDGDWYSKGNINVCRNIDCSCHLTINSGTMVAGGVIFLGNQTVFPDTGESRIFLNGGLLQGEDLQFKMSNSLIIYRGGELWINNSAVTETDMQYFIDIGKIDVPSNYEITTIGDYTVLRS